MGGHRGRQAAVAGKMGSPCWLEEGRPDMLQWCVSVCSRQAERRSEDHRRLQDSRSADLPSHADMRSVQSSALGQAPAPRHSVGGEDARDRASPWSRATFSLQASSREGGHAQTWLRRRTHRGVRANATMSEYLSAEAGFRSFGFANEASLQVAPRTNEDAHEHVRRE